MLLVLLFSSWLYIALHGSSANRERYEEAELLRERFRQEFLLLHTLFLGGVFCTFVGLIAVMSLKVSTLFLSWLAWGITFGSGVCAFALFLKLPWEVYYLNQTIDKVRGFDKAKLAVEYENALKAVCRHLRSLDSVEGSLEEIECLRHIRRAGGRGRAGGPGPGPAARGARDGGRAGPVRDSRE
jgi:ABC-type transport system involved in cytochrome bd biosynthesis fused ATPase/permease subunit